MQSGRKMDRQKIDEVLKAAFSKVRGLEHWAPLPDTYRRKILDIEEESEKNSLMGLGKVINTGIRKVLDCELIYVALTNMAFDWGCHPTLVMKKGREVVGEEVRDKNRIAQLSTRDDVWFMHRNFVVYKNKISFPQDVMKKICYFEIPCLPAEWCVFENDKMTCRTLIYANPSTHCDVYLKEKFFNGTDEKGLGTILIGVSL